MKAAFQCFAVKNSAFYAEWAPYGLKTFISTCEAKGGFGQIVDANYLVSPAHVLLAVANVLESIQEDSLHNRSASIELLARLAGKRQFVDALKMGVTPQTTTLAVIAVSNAPKALIDQWAKTQSLSPCSLHWKNHLAQNEKQLFSFFQLESVQWPKRKTEHLALLKQLVEEKVALAFL